MQETSIVRENLMNKPGYSPYCGHARCRYHMPRTHFDGEQFKCICGWRSEFPADFIARYKARWSDEDAKALETLRGLP